MTRSEVRKKDNILRAVTYIISIALGLFILVPFLSMLMGKFGDPYIDEEVENIIAHDLLKFWKQFILVFNSGQFTNFMNSVIVSVLSTVFCMYVSAMTAYGITAYEWKLREAFDKMILIIVMIPGTISTIGFYQLIYKFHLINLLSMLILPAIASPLTVLFMRLYLKATFSKALVESARLDGAGEFRIFNQIILPLLKPAIATQAIFCFVTSWHNTLIPSIILIEESKRTLPVSNNTLGTELLLFLPPILVYAFLSKHIVEGIALGGVKT